MKKEILFLIRIIVLVAISIPAVAREMTSDTTACEEYKHINFSVSLSGSNLRYDQSNNGTIEPPNADSVWIMWHTEDTISVVYTGHAQSGEFIDISAFERGYYVLHVLIGECEMSRMFVYRGRSVTRVQDAVVNDAAAKILRNGQIYILRGENIYTLHGQQVE